MVELENIGPVEDGIHVDGIGATGVNYEAIELLINFVNTLWQEWYLMPQVMRLNGGGIKRQRSFQRAPIRPPPRSRLGTLNDLVEIGSLLRNEFQDWHESYDATFPGHGRSTAGVVDSTVSASPEWWRERPSEDLIGTLLLGTALNIGRRLRRNPIPLRLTYPGYESGGSGKSPIPPDFYARTTTDIQIGLPKMNGYAMLEWKNRLTRKLKTHFEYRMSPLLLSQQQPVPDPTAMEDGYAKKIQAGSYANYSTMTGTGPCLMGSYVRSPLVIGSDAAKTLNVNPELAELEIEDIGFFENAAEWAAATDDTRQYTRGLGYKNVVYWFAADWIGGAMNPMKPTQHMEYDWTAGTTNGENVMDTPYPLTNNKTAFNQRGGNCLLMKKVDYNTTTDLNLPVDLENLFLGIQKWTYITHYYTVWNFKFTNYAETPYCIEFVKFKFKADIDSFNYERAALAVVDRQRHKFQDYVDGVSPEPSDIVILYRKRMVIGGLNQPRNALTAAATNWSTSNTIVWKYVQKRKYVIKRPIVNSWDETFDDFSGFNTYYEKQTGEYIRLQAWPMTPYIVYQAQATDYAIEPLNMNYPNVTGAQIKGQTTAAGVATTTVMTRNGTTFCQGVGVVIDKKSYFKLDENQV